MRVAKEDLGPADSGVNRTNTFDGSGRIRTRTLAGGGVQTFTWDATGKLVRVVQTGTGAYTWQAVYDALGRRIKTSYTPSGGSAVEVKSWYDPQVEFLEIAVEAFGKRWWKAYGPDPDAGYGSFQGVGGLIAVRDEASGKSYRTLDDAFGHTVGYAQIDFSGAKQHTLKWHALQMSGYGPLPGSAMTALENQAGSDIEERLVQSIAWQSRRIDPTGLFYMGARYYDPVSGSFLSADPLGHEASLDLYSYAGGDPINRIDPDGRKPCKGDGVTQTVIKVTFNQPVVHDPINDIARTGARGLLGATAAQFSIKPSFGIVEKGGYQHLAIVEVKVSLGIYIYIDPSYANVANPNSQIMQLIMKDENEHVVDIEALYNSQDFQTQVECALSVIANQTAIYNSNNAKNRGSEYNAFMREVDLRINDNALVVAERELGILPLESQLSIQMIDHTNNLRHDDGSGNNPHRHDPSEVDPMKDPVP